MISTNKKHKLHLVTNSRPGKQNRLKTQTKQQNDAKNESFSSYEGAMSSPTFLCGLILLMWPTLFTIVNVIMLLIS